MSQRLEWAIVIARCPSSGRPSAVVRPLTFHIFDFFSRTSWWILMKFCRYEVLMVPYKCCCFRQILPGADPGRGKNRSRGVPFCKKLLLQTGRVQRQTECIAMITKHVGRSVVIFGSILKSNFWRVFDVFLYLVLFAHFNAISIDFLR